MSATSNRVLGCVKSPTDKVKKGFGHSVLPRFQLWAVLVVSLSISDLGVDNVICI